MNTKDEKPDEKESKEPLEESDLESEEEVFSDSVELFFFSLQRRSPGPCRPKSRRGA